MVTAVLLLLALAPPSFPATCAGATSLGDFNFVVITPDGSRNRPVRQMNRLPKGHHLRFDPVQKNLDEDARVTVLLVPAGKDASDLLILEPKPARTVVEWEIPERSSAVALVYGPNGLSVKKLKDMGERNPQLVAELAAYARQSAQVEALVDALAQHERGETTLDAALSGFSSRFGVAMPKLEAGASTDQQANVLLRALLPSMSSYDPLSANRASVMQQSAGLATSVAGMFWGNPVGLAAGGAALFQNLRTIMFPGTEFRTAFAQSDSDTLSLCAKSQPSKSRTRLAYLWAYKVPDAEAPELSLINDFHVPMGAKSTVSITGKGLPLASRLSAWRLGGKPVSVSVAGDRLTLDLAAFSASEGPAELTASWDWDPVQIRGKLHLHRLDDLSKATPDTGVLVEGLGKTKLPLRGPDFQFLEHVKLDGTEVPFHLAQGPRGGEQSTVEIDLDTTGLQRGQHSLSLVQGDGTPAEVKVTVLPPHPRVENAPLRVNLGEKTQIVPLRGSGLDRIQEISAPEVGIELLPGSEKERSIRVSLGSKARKGEVLQARMKVADVLEALPLEPFAKVAGPRPIISASGQTLNSTVSLRPHEIVAGNMTSFSITTRNVSQAPAMHLSCREGEQRAALTLRPGDRNPAATLNLAGDGLLFLSLDPGAVGYPGCEVAAVLETSEGQSDPLPLGRVTRIPIISKFVLTEERLGDNVFAGMLTGSGLETIEKTGWDKDSGIPVTTIPSPAPDDPSRQTLKVALPWPSPSPHAPVYIWLRGETEGRATGVRY